MRTKGLAVVLAAGVTLGACTTTHQLGRLDDPAEQARLQALFLTRPTTATITGVPSQPEPLRAVDITRAGLHLQLQDPPAQFVVPTTQLRYFSVVSRPRGALEGALIVGVPAVVLGVIVGVAVGSSRRNALIGAVVGLYWGGLIGGGVGALVGHEDRYVVARPEP